MNGWELSPEHSTEAVAAFVAALNEMPDVQHDSTANIPGKDGKPGYQYTFASHKAVLSATRAVLKDHGLAVTQTVGNDGKDVRVTTIVLHDSGGWIAGEPMRMPTGSTPQAAGSSLSYARRYSLLAMLNLSTSDDDDGALATQNIEHERNLAAAVQRGSQRQEQARPATGSRSTGDRPARTAAADRLEAARQRGGGAAPAPSREARTEARTDEEAAIRRSIAELPRSEGDQLRQAFLAEFKANLSGLEVNRHGEALVFVNQWIAQQSEPSGEDVSTLLDAAFPGSTYEDVP